MGTSDGPVWAVVLAGGRGARFGRLKQFEPLGGVRLVDRTVATARRTCDRVALVLPDGVEWDGPAVDALAVGGDHQSESMRAALAVVPDDAGVIVATDPAHPLAPDRVYTDVVAAVRAGADGAVPVLPLLEVIQRVVDGRVVETLPKADAVVTQAPHAFRADALRAVHADRPRPVENSGLLVEHGYRVVAVEGHPANLHVATEADLTVMEHLAHAMALADPVPLPDETHGARRTAGVPTPT
ncbi:IspD/TarI family cytidylyltransferase [Pseudonocardia endophytica]|uniref:2-C-methyl-D-erythritol 4-phosphate cytidylyltransferase n=1 Tax=Pseudonocardia endophytica TaxID=401976 RepID=A0A4R1I345_PSEEN|nr:2-C-methyl-D-erythritol 4-phosphate cytidylyltransferase [Pseudonocardia endophytica]TCK27750.1 2-C-methyl-D-erythritol 4-phosphate cytidylyltransferase [Pseudonocardia endophytica]